MVLMEAIGLAAAEVFDYNRENFEQDQEQRIKRDLQRVEMQITRFDLFRQDIEDLYKLTVDKMDMYHLVGALFLGFTATFFTEGRIMEAVVPPFYVGAYFLAVACALCYLLLAVWLSMHASISSHSFGVRLRTRYVRLPIPSASQLAGLAARLSDFEKTGATNIFRAPFAGKAGTAFRGAIPEDATLEGGKGKSGVSAEALRGRTDIHGEELLGDGHTGFDSEQVLVSAAVSSPGRHVQMFRRLQAKWQCFDAYARVCMALGVAFITQSVEMYLFGILLLQRRSITTAIAVIVVFQSASLGLLILDIAGIKRWKIFVVQVMHSLPVIGVCASLSMAPRDDTHAVELDNEYPLAPISFAFQAVCLEVMLYLAKPSNDQASLPRNFRSVLFLDVFGDAAYDPVDAETDDAGRRDIPHEASTAAAERSLVFAWMALRRWEAVPEHCLSADRSASRASLRKDLVMWRKLLMRSVDANSTSRSRAASVIDSLGELRSWDELTAAEKTSDVFARCLLGPLRGEGAGPVYDLENEKLLDLAPDGHGVLSLIQVADLVNASADSVRRVMRQECGSTVATTAASSSSERLGRGGTVATLASEATGAYEEPGAVRRGADGRAKFTQVDRMPWSTTKRLTRVLQFCWLLLAVLQALQLRYFGVFRIDYPLAQSERRRLAAGPPGPPEPRRLAGDAPATELSLRRLALDRGPHGEFLPLASIAAPPLSSQLLLGGGALVYAAADIEPDGVTARLRVDQRPLPRSRFPGGAVPLCAAAAGTVAGGPGDLCLWGSLAADGVELWPFGAPRAGGASLLRPWRSGPAWRSLAGGVFRCSSLEALRPEVAMPEDGSSGEWCLLLAGWDGDQIPLVVVQLPGAPSEPPATGANVTAFVDAPLRPALAPSPIDVPQRGRRLQRGGAGRQSAAGRLLQPVGAQAAGFSECALHVDPGGGRLWAALDDGSLQAWDLLRLESVGHWRLRRGRIEVRGDAGARVLGICEDWRGSRGGGHRLLLVASVQGVAGEARQDVYEAEIPQLGSAARL